MRHLRPSDLPVQPPQTTFLPSGFPMPGKRLCRLSPGRAPSSVGLFNARRLFRSSLSSAPPEDQGGPRLPCRARRRARRARARGSLRFQHRGPPGPFYLRHAPRLLPFEHLADKPGTGYHPGRKSPSPISSTLQKRSHVARGFVGPVVSPYVQASRPGAVSEREQSARFLGVDTTSAPLPFSGNPFAFRHVSSLPHRQALGGPFIVELFTAGFSRPVPECCHPPGFFCRQKKAPDAGLR